MKMNETLDEYYDLIEIYKDLDSYDKEMIWSIMQTVKKEMELIHTALKRYESI